VGWMRWSGAAGRLGATVLAVAVLAAATPAAAADGFTPGSPGLGDPFFPLAGNGGYDVAHYGLRLGYDPATRRRRACRPGRRSRSWSATPACRP